LPDYHSLLYKDNTELARKDNRFWTILQIFYEKNVFGEKKVVVVITFIVV